MCPPVHTFDVTKLYISYIFCILNTLIASAKTDIHTNTLTLLYLLQVHVKFCWVCWMEVVHSLWAGGHVLVGCMDVMAQWHCCQAYNPEQYQVARWSRWSRIQMLKNLEQHNAVKLHPLKVDEDWLIFTPKGSLKRASLFVSRAFGLGKACQYWADDCWNLLMFEMFCLQLNAFVL